jgi:hypothetical protein
MRPGRELDVQVAQEVLGHRVFVKNKKLFEETPAGERPLRFFDSDLNDAWEVAEKFRIALLPVDRDQWFAFAGQTEGWKSPTELLEFLQAGKFEGCGASVGKNAAKVICHAAVNAANKRKAEAEKSTSEPAESAEAVRITPDSQSEMTH